MIHIIIIDIRYYNTFLQRVSENESESESESESDSEIEKVS